MAKVTGPLMSMDASGSVGKAITFAKWKGRNYVRELVTPSNPKTAAQTSMRAMLSFLSKAWAALGSISQSTWAEAADAIKASPFNAYTQQNLKNWRDYLAPSQYTPAARTVTAGTPSAPICTVNGRQVAIQIANTPGDDDWAIFVHRSQSDGFPPSAATLIKVHNLVDGASATISDGPLEPGTYFYKCVTGSADGLFSAASAQDDAVVQ